MFMYQGEGGRRCRRLATGDAAADYPERSLTITRLWGWTVGPLARMVRSIATRKSTRKLVWAVPKLSTKLFGHCRVGPRHALPKNATALFALDLGQRAIFSHRRIKTSYRTCSVFVKTRRDEVQRNRPPCFGYRFVLWDFFYRFGPSRRSKSSRGQIRSQKQPKRESRSCGAILGSDRLCAAGST